MIRNMEARDIEAAMRLKNAANWNQTRWDWERLLRLEPAGCFVDERAGTVVGSTTALRHGTDLAWIGMVLVLPGFRRRGIARRLVHHAMAWLRASGNHVVGLDATEMGLPLYEQLGFRTAEVIERWERPPVRADEPATAETGVALRDSLLALDKGACGYDRSALIRDLFADDSVESMHSASGFAFGRPGSAAWFVGPCVALRESDAESLLVGLLGTHADELVFWDLLPSSAPARRVARRLGFRPVRRLTRMLRTAGRHFRGHARPDRVFATAGFEFG